MLGLLEVQAIRLGAVWEIYVCVGFVYPYPLLRLLSAGTLADEYAGTQGRAL
jgi:hypothetical protein